MKRIALMALALMLPTALVWSMPVQAEDPAPKAAEDGVETARKAFAEYKSAQEASNKARGDAMKAYREAKEGEAKDAAAAKYQEVSDAENAKVKAASDKFVEALTKAGVDSFDVEKDADLLEIGLMTWASKKGEEDPKGAAEIYELFLKKLPNAKAAPFVRTSYLPNALMSSGDFEAAAKRIGELAKQGDEKYAPSLNMMLGDIKAIQGDIEGAQKIYAEVLKSIPEKLERNDPRSSVKRYIDPKIALIGKQAPEIDSKTWLGGEAQPLSKLKGTVVLIDVWATW
ncbi:MAG: hypothetical protein IT461_07850 [Planctomycetes bacterium]|jgi:tetratricopeptide (TPR) repeat protein|nr:hypothetical protein [Planctomycetota bacterium]